MKGWVMSAVDRVKGTVEDIIDRFNSGLYLVRNKTKQNKKT